MSDGSLLSPDVFLTLWRSTTRLQKPMIPLCPLSCFFPFLKVVSMGAFRDLPWWCQDVLENLWVSCHMRVLGAGESVGTHRTDGIELQTAVNSCFVTMGVSQEPSSFQPKMSTCTPYVMCSYERNQYASQQLLTSHILADVVWKGNGPTGTAGKHPNPAGVVFDRLYSL